VVDNVVADAAQKQVSERIMPPCAHHDLGAAVPHNVTDDGAAGTSSILNDLVVGLVALVRVEDADSGTVRMTFPASMNGTESMGGRFRGHRRGAKLIAKR
jgi:hypothetical protein